MNIPHTLSNKNVTHKNQAWLFFWSTYIFPLSTLIFLMTNNIRTGLGTWTGTSLSECRSTSKRSFSQATQIWWHQRATPRTWQYAQFQGGQSLIHHSSSLMTLYSETPNQENKTGLQIPLGLVFPPLALKQKVSCTFLTATWSPS